MRLRHTHTQLNSSAGQAHLSRRSLSNVKVGYIWRGGEARRHRPTGSCIGTIEDSGRAGMPRLLTWCHRDDNALWQNADFTRRRHLVKVALSDGFNFKENMTAFRMAVQEGPANQRAPALFCRRTVGKLHLKLQRVGWQFGRP